MLRSIKERLFVLLVGEDPEIEGLGQVGDLLQLLTAEHDAGRVVAVAHHEELGAGRGAAGQLFEVEPPFRPIPVQRYGDDVSPGHADRRLGAGVLRVHQQDFIAGADENAEGAVDDLLAADRRQDLIVRVGLDPVFTGELGGDGLAEIAIPLDAWVVRIGLDRVAGRVTHEIGG